METHAEVVRLQEVYREYAARGFGKSKWSEANRGNQALRLERETGMRRLLQRFGFVPLTERRILDVGCGAGQQLGRLLDWGAQPENLVGIDLMPDRVQAARRAFPRVSFHLGNAESVPYADGAFDLVVVSTVFSSILKEEMASNLAREIHRLLTRGGAVLWYDFRMNNPFNRQVRGLSRQHVQTLFPAFRPAWEVISVLPPLARHLGPLAPWLYRPLSMLPFLRTHLLGLLIKT